MILDGKKLSDKILNEVQTEYYNLIEQYKRRAFLTFIMVGDDYASKIYVKNKEIICKKIGIDTKTIILEENISKENLLEIISKENMDNTVDGILLQLPLPKHIDTLEILKHIDYRKDVDGSTPYNLGKLVLNDYFITPCTPSGILKLLEEYNIDVVSKDVLIIGRSNLVGKPLSIMLLNKSATVTIAHTKTKNLKEKIKNADILITATGCIDILTEKNQLKKGVVIIDVGTNRVNGKLRGDVDYIKLLKNPNVKYITPTPGGIGPMTISMLIKNIIKIYKYRNENIFK